jgi:hypothetical protein
LTLSFGGVSWLLINEGKPLLAIYSDSINDHELAKQELPLSFALWYKLRREQAHAFDQ